MKRLYTVNYIDKKHEFKAKPIEFNPNGVLTARSYQDDLFKWASQSVLNNFLINAPMGCGKSMMLLMLANMALQKKQKVIITVPNKVRG